MTTIAWDGKTLSADKRAIAGGLIRTVTKIRRLSDGRLFGASGEISSIFFMLNWIEGGMQIEKFPESQKNSETWARTIVVNKDGTYVVFERSPHQLVYEEKHFATGSGRDYAFAAMHCGKSSEEAVKIAAFFDECTGNGVDTLEL